MNFMSTVFTDHHPMGGWLGCEPSTTATTSTTTNQQYPRGSLAKQSRGLVGSKRFDCRLPRPSQAERPPRRGLDTTHHHDSNNHQRTRDHVRVAPLIPSPPPVLPLDCLNEEERAYLQTPGVGDAVVQLLKAIVAADVGANRITSLAATLTEPHQSPTLATQRPREQDAAATAASTEQGVWQVDRSRDGLLEVPEGRMGLLDGQLPSEEGLQRALGHARLPHTPEYRHCPECGFVTKATLLHAHYSAEHPDRDLSTTAVNGGAVSLGSLLADAKQAAQRMLIERRAHGLKDLHDLTALRLYTMDCPVYRHVNDAIRRQLEGVVEEWKDFVLRAQRALESLPVYEGTTYRGIDCAVDPTLYREGSVVTWRGFSSSTTNVKVAKTFLGGGERQRRPKGTLFIIESLTARPVHQISAIPSQDEVLFGINSQFRVVGKMSGGSMRLLAQAMDVDLTDITVYELKEVQLSTCEGVLNAMTQVERLAGSKKLVDLLTAHGEEDFVQVAATPVDVLERTDDEDDDESYRDVADIDEDSGEEDEEGMPQVPYRQYLLDVAAEVGEHYPAVLKLLVAAGANPALGAPATTYVRYTSHCTPATLDTFHWLIQHGAVPDAVDGCDQTALNWASGDEDLVDYVPELLQLGVDLDFPGGADWKTPLMVAALKGYGDTVEHLLRPPSTTVGMPVDAAEVNAKDSEGRTALFLAAQYKHTAVVETLLQHGAQQTPADDRRTPLIVASEYGCLASVQALVRYGADVNAVDENGRTAAMWASSHGHREVLDYLVSQGAERVLDVQSMALVVWRPPPLLAAGVLRKAERTVPKPKRVRRSRR